VSTFSVVLWCNPVHTYLSTERPGNIRLVGGSNAWEGRVEIYLSGNWTTVSDGIHYGHGTKAANVVCRQLGYSGGKRV